MECARASARAGVRGRRGCGSRRPRSGDASRLDLVVPDRQSCCRMGLTRAPPASSGQASRLPTLCVCSEQDNDGPDSYSARCVVPQQRDLLRVFRPGDRTQAQLLLAAVPIQGHFAHSCQDPRVHFFAPYMGARGAAQGLGGLRVGGLLEVLLYLPGGRVENGVCTGAGLCRSQGVPHLSGVGFRAVGLPAMMMAGRPGSAARARTGGGYPVVPDHARGLQPCPGPGHVQLPAVVTVRESKPGRVALVSCISCLKYC
jgi:hypothetical protein